MELFRMLLLQAREGKKTNLRIGRLIENLRTLWRA